MSSGNIKGRSRRSKKRTLAARDGLTCHWCYRTMAFESLTLDHLVPVSRGGSNKNENLVLACAECNNRRSNPPSDPHRWRRAYASPRVQAAGEAAEGSQS